MFMYNQLSAWSCRRGEGWAREWYRYGLFILSPTSVHLLLGRQNHRKISIETQPLRVGRDLPSELLTQPEQPE